MYHPTPLLASACLAGLTPLLASACLAGLTPRLKSLRSRLLGVPPDCSASPHIKFEKSTFSEVVISRWDPLKKIDLA